MRLFIAIGLEASMKAALVDMQEQLRTRRVGGTYTREENLHLTLAFLGEYGDPEGVLEVMDTVPLSPFPLRLEGYGCFGDLYWCGLARQEALERYVTRLRRALSQADIPFDRKRFSSHITLLRRASAIQMPPLHVPQAAMEVRAVSLMRSVRGKNGMIYTELGRTEATYTENLL